MRIDGLKRRSERSFRLSVARFVLAKVLEAPAGANGVNMPLGKDGAEPGFQRAASVEVAKERTLRAFAIRQTVQLRKEGICKIAGLGRTHAAAKNCGCGSAQVGAVGSEKMFPGGLAPIGASGGQRKIFELQRAQIFLELLRRYRSWGQRLL